MPPGEPRETRDRCHKPGLRGGLADHGGWKQLDHAGEPRPGGRPGNPRRTRLPHQLLHSVVPQYPGKHHFLLGIGDLDPAFQPRPDHDLAGRAIGFRGRLGLRRGFLDHVMNTRWRDSFIARSIDSRSCASVQHEKTSITTPRPACSASCTASRSEWVK